MIKSFKKYFPHFFSICVSFSGFANATCLEDSSVVGVNLVDNSELVDTNGAVIANLDYLEVVKVLQSSGNVVVVETLNGETGRASKSFLRVYESFGQSCRAKRITVGELVGKEDSRADNPLEAKVIIANTVERVVRIIDDGEASNAITVRNGPSVDAEIIGELTVFDVVNVHGFYHSDVDTWLFVGGRDRSFDNHLSSLVGWVNFDDVLLWPQRQAVYPHERANLQIFGDTKFKTPILELNRVFDSDKERNLAIGKMPLLDGSSGKNGIFKVAAVGERIGKDGISGDLPDDFRQKFWRALKDLEKRDILFVIDNTESMEKYRKPVVDGILDFVSSFEDSSSTRVAFALHGDKFTTNEEFLAWVSSQKNVDPVVVSHIRKNDTPFQFSLYDFNSSGNTLSLKDFNEFFGDTYKDPQKDPREMSFAAIATAINAATWRKGRTVKAVVFIGDDSDRTREISAAANSIVTNNILLVPINVAGGRIDTFNNEWLADAQSLRDRVSELEGDSYPSGLVMLPSKAYETSQNTELRTTRDQVRSVLSAFFVIDSSLGGLTATDFLTDPSAVGNAIDESKAKLDDLKLPSGELFEAYLQSRGIGSSEDIKEFYQTSESVIVGYMAAKDARVYVAMSNTELAGLYSAMTLVCSGMTDSLSFPRTMERVATNVAEAFLGENRNETTRGSLDNNEPIADFFSRVSYLPADYFSVFGSYSVSEFITFIGKKANKQLFQEVHKEICLSARLLQGIRDYEYISRSDIVFEGFEKRYNEPRWSVGEVKEFDWLWGTPAGSNYFFVPDTFFPRKAF